MKVLDKIKAIKNKKRKALKVAGVAVAGVATVGVTVFVTRQWDKEHADKLLGVGEIMCGIKKPVDIPFDKSKCEAGKLVELWRDGDFVTAIIENAKPEALSDFLCAVQDEIGGLDQYDIIVSGTKS